MQTKKADLALYITVVFSLLACVGLSPASQAGSSPGIRAAVSEPSVSESSAGTSKANPVFDAPGFWDTAPSPDFLFFIGASAIRSDQEESIRLALEDAARKVAMYHFLEGRYESHLDAGTGFLEYSAGTVSSLNYDKDYLKYAEELVYDADGDILQWENSLFVRARYPRAGREIPSPVKVAAGLPANGPPPWVNTPPGGTPGYIYGVGLASRRSYHRDTVNASCEAAVFSLIRNLSSRVTGGTADVWKSSAFGYSGAAGASVSSALSLEGFYVLDVWIDPVSKAVWTLALARENSGIEGETIEKPGELGY